MESYYQYADGSPKPGYVKDENGDIFDAIEEDQEDEAPYSTQNDPDFQNKAAHYRELIAAGKL